MTGLAGLPPCAAVALADSYDGPDSDPKLDCALESSDRLKLTFEVLGSPPETIKVFDTQGRQLQTLVQKVEQPQRQLPILEDIDKDGRDELLVTTTAGGSGGADMGVWHAVGDSPRFKDAGSVFGFSGFWKTAQGFFANYAHSSANSGEVAIYRFAQGKLATVATLDVEAQIDPTTRKATGTTCELDDSAGLAAAGIDPSAAEQQLCSEPWLSTIYNN